MPSEMNPENAETYDSEMEYARLFSISLEKDYVGCRLSPAVLHVDKSLQPGI